MKVMTETGFLADTYALIELIGGNPNYKPYTKCVMATTKFNMAELYYHYLREHGMKTADRYLQALSEFVIPVSYGSISLGMQFKLRHKNEKLSYTDCIGYALAMEMDVRFLTGDNKFRGKDNVEFVK